MRWGAPGNIVSSGCLVRATTGQSSLLCAFVIINADSKETLQMLSEDVCNLHI